MAQVRYICLIIALFSLPLTAYSEAKKIKIAMPRDYNALANELLGTREEGFGVAVGTDVSGLVVRSIEGAAYPMDELWRSQPAMIIFYRGGWCPFCNAQVRELSMAHPQFEKRGIQLALISVDKPDAGAMLKQTYDVPFPVLSDQDLAAHKAFNVVMQIPEERAQKAKDTFGLDFKEWSGRGHLTIAVASSFLVDTDGRVQWSTVIKDYSLRPSKEQLLALIDNQGNL